MNYLAVLLTVHNRKNKTLKCLEKLNAQLPIKDWVVDIFMTDDGCTDDTPFEVVAQYPKIQIIRGSGNLYWNGGMRIAWEKARQHMDYTAYLWLNDDTILLDNALNLLIDSHVLQPKSIIVGTTKASLSNNITYGGFKDYHDQDFLIPNGDLQKCGLFTGNIVLIPKYVYDVIGNLDSMYSHALGDIDYGLMANENSIESFVCGEVIGICDRNMIKPKWMCPEFKLIERIRNLYSPLSYFPPKEYFYFKKKHWGYSVAIVSIISIYFKCLFPSLLKK